MSIELIGGASGVKANTSPDGALYVKEYENETFFGTYCLEGVIAALSATAHTLNTGGFFWAINPAASGKIIRIERVGIQINLTTAVAAGFPTAPRLAISRMAFTGTPSGAAVPTSGSASTINKFDNNYPTPVLDIRSAITGLTCTYGAVMFSSMAPSMGVVGTVTASQVVGIPSDNEFEPRETDYELIIRPGEGFVIWQPEAGSTADTRKATFRIMWEEVTIP
jgi:hypothetical protein